MSSQLRVVGSSIKAEFRALPEDLAERLPTVVRQYSEKAKDDIFKHAVFYAEPGLAHIFSDLDAGDVCRIWVFPPTAPASLRKALDSATEAWAKEHNFPAAFPDPLCPEGRS